MVEGYVEDEAHRHMVVDSHKEVYHSHWIDMYHGIVVAHSALEEVVAKKIDHKHIVPPTFNCSILDACCHCNLHLLQHSCNHNHTQMGENS
ncbi:hypothetical protein AHAS_Ahas13G0262300 [Arachis hypogaea]